MYQLRAKRKKKLKLGSLVDEGATSFTARRLRFLFFFFIAKITNLYYYEVL